ncbi:FecR family protein [Agrobacterium pusense]|uniref:FecR family protein n=1 Tax=Agrobacterium pusense TaxID=648995 RepID=UPI00345ED565
MQDSSLKEHCADNDPELSRRAAEWFALLLDESATPLDRANFRVWMEQCPAHAKAYAELERLWLGASALPEISNHAFVNRRTILKSGGALVILTAAGVGTNAYLRQQAEYSTAVGETARFSLPDGTVAELSTGSAISLNFDAGQRRVTLQQGEAFFTVARDAARPFDVDCNGLRALALGTQFSVGMHDEGTVVAVAEHTVQVSSLRQELLVQEGQSVLFADDRLSPPSNIDIDTKLSWRSGKLVFISATFEDVVSALSKWRYGKMIVMDKALARRPISIIVDVRRAGRILDNLEHSLPIRIARYSPLLTLIYPR